MIVRREAVASPFDPFVLPAGQVLRNRLILAPMTTYSSYEDGTIRETEIEYLRRRAAGGFGMVMTAACYVHGSGQAFKGQWSCADDRFLPSLRSVAEAIGAEGAFSVLQIHHGGRQCPSELCGGQPWSASAVPSERPNAEVPRPMTDADIETVVQAFACAARRAHEAGFDGVEIHGANTYLLQQFVSPHSNRRDDRWGQDHLAFPLAVTDAVLGAVPTGYPIGYRFSPEEAETPGIRWSDTARLIDALCARPLAFLHVSLRDHRAPSLNGEFDEPTLRRVGRQIAGRLPLIGVGGVKELADAQRVLDSGADLVAIGRVGISDPEWPRHAQAGEAIRTKVPARDAERVLTIPAGLAARIATVPGWFEVEEEPSGVR